MILSIKGTSRREITLQLGIVFLMTFLDSTCDCISKISSILNWIYLNWLIDLLKLMKNILCIILRIKIK